MEPGMVATLTDGHRLVLEALPLKGEGLLAFSRRLTGGEEAARRISLANDGVEQLRAGVRYRVPLEVLRPDLQLALLKALFTEDQVSKDGWRHTVRGVGPLGRGSLWHLAEWFTGRGENFQALRRANGLSEEDLAPGEVVTIPVNLLRPALRSALPRGPSAEDFDLRYGRDRRGNYAVYRLKAGEALYSSVVVRFTGHITAADVNSLALEIAERSGIADVTDIPVGYPVKISFDLLLPEFLPADHPRRIAYEESLMASSAYSNEVRSRDLAGITVVLDPGHGGQDVGASFDGVWESLYVYDVTLRVKRLLETRTAAQVYTTTRDGGDYTVPDRDVLPFSRSHRVLTHPAYPIEDSVVGVHLRWYLANSLYRRAVERSGDPEKVVFLSIHGDSLHPSLQGMMAYIPAANLSGGRWGKSGAVYASRREVKERPRGEYSWKDRVKSEGLSRQLAERMVRAFREAGLPVHPFKPVREKVIRNRREWVPAVLRYNAVPAKALVEICNLANPEDRRQIQTRSYREAVAEAIVRGILAYYGQGEVAPLPVGRRTR
jgi:N-acetylmuramoyl-L-alanine amidase